MDLTLHIFTPIGIVLDTPVTQVDFEAVNGFFTILPRHADIVSALKIGVLSYTTDGQKKFAACDKGVLVKKGSIISISTKRAILGTDLKELEQKIKTDFKEIEQERKEMNATMAKLEVGLAKGILSLNQGGSNGPI